ncbi:two-component system CheB/CheR fusion protein [Rhizomicrobium palustre]|uniref:histidine kinase n=1 Tax=Rhizomicrobium palustre TaxID=189966 RepID=A0A846MTW2_9PROT|nr:two-component system CheB/CheR fusion protein [Rhizomicrobium palustre]
MRPTSGDFPVAAIGASAGGLEAFRKFLGALPVDTGMAFILVQHLDPTHESMIVDLLVGNTAMTIQQAVDGMPIERDHVYVIPPGTYLAVANGSLQLTQPKPRQGARLPFDYLLHSLARDCGRRAMCVVLSGTGSDGSLGLRSIRENGGYVIAQDPGDAGYDGMPTNAIATGDVNVVLAVERIPGALIRYAKGLGARPQAQAAAQEDTDDRLPEIIELLRTKTAHDFSLYKPGTLRRRIDRRMGMTVGGSGEIGRYVDLLRRDIKELDLLAKDLLINVTSFFRDPKVFDLLAEKIIPDLIKNHPVDRPLRVWVAGCSSGEEAYSLAILFCEQITAAKREIRLQIFASDIDPDAITTARDALYPGTISAEISPERLSRFFVKEGRGYRVSPDLRAAVVFTVQDVLSDPPFSRLDMVSCRNLLIYLGPDAQKRALARFHFALRDGGILLLGGSESAATESGYYTIVSEAERVYRHIGRSQPEASPADRTFDYHTRLSVTPWHKPVVSRQVAIAELCRRAVMDAYAPAAVLINEKFECLYSLGPVDRYMQMAPGFPTLDLFAMTRADLRAKLRSAVKQAFQENTLIMVAGGGLRAGLPAFNIVVRPITYEAEKLLLICFVDEPKETRKPGARVAAKDASRVAELESELRAARKELEGAVRNLELSVQEQNAINEEALSVNEEFQSTNEELLASKEELQSLNEELTALNTQLQETLELQRRTSDDLQNVLYSTNVATLFLDTELAIRFFTPATKLLFRVLPGDVGRPLADLSSVAVDSALISDAQTVLKTFEPIEREIEAQSGAWYVRRVLPYRTKDDVVEGVIITFVDSTERRQVAEALLAAKAQAEQASIAKSRFLAVASHDLRQPLQTLALLQGLLAKAVDGPKAQKLIDRFDDTLTAMSDMLNTLLDINQIDAGTVQAEPSTFKVNDLFERLRDEFSYHAQAKGLTLRVIPCDLSIYTDPRLLEQMIRNLLANAMKFTARGKILLGCRRQRGKLSIQIWDTGIGIPQEELQAIFVEYHQLDNDARERSRGLGLGLSIVQRLAALLGHRVRVQSRPGRGSVFCIELDLPGVEKIAQPHLAWPAMDSPIADGRGRSGTVLVIEDDPEVRELLDLTIQDEGFVTAAVCDGAAALDLVERGVVKPDLVLADFNLPNRLNGLQASAKLREKLRREVPVIILTGDTSTGALRDIAERNCLHLNKPVKLKELMAAIRRLLPAAEAHPLGVQETAVPSAPEKPVVYVIDDDADIRDGVRTTFEGEGLAVEDYADAEEFLGTYRPAREGCLLIDAYLPGLSGLELLDRLHRVGHRLPAIMITGHSDVPIAVKAMKAGALDFLEKPVSAVDLVVSVRRALEQWKDTSKLSEWREEAAHHLEGLTPRQRQVMEMVLAGHPSKNIAADLGVSQRTVENHRAAIMKKTGVKSLPALARLAVAAASASEAADGGN